MNQEWTAKDEAEYQSSMRRIAAEEEMRLSDEQFREVIQAALLQSQAERLEAESALKRERKLHERTQRRFLGAAIFAAVLCAKHAFSALIWILLWFGGPL